MKKLIPLLFLPVLAQAGFSKPQLMARFMAVDAWNVPDNTWCFAGEPTALKNKIYLNCLDVNGNLMASWNEGKFEVVARSNPETLFSKPLVAFNQVNWYEFEEFSPLRTFIAAERLEIRTISNLGPMSSRPTDSFLPLTKDTFFFKNKWEDSQLWSWKNNVVTPFFNPEASYIFTPHPGLKGEISFKTRHLSTEESAPDRLWHYDGKEWKVVLEDKDANPESKWKSFRHQMGVEGNKVVVVAKDGSSDSLLLIEGNRVQILARAGKDLKEFDFFTPKIQAGTLVIRGVDFHGNKAVYVKDNGSFRKLITQGDIIQADKGQAMVFYPNEHAIFYGAPGLDEKGNIYLHATLSDPLHPETLLGVGLLKFQKE